MSDVKRCQTPSNRNNTCSVRRKAVSDTFPTRVTRAVSDVSGMKECQT
ncbi:MAG: hypothetical protein LBK25_04445 [Treponema sp.]|nr:hypothetical protein [Treponema sp.]